MRSLSGRLVRTCWIALAVAAAPVHAAATVDQLFTAVRIDNLRDVRRLIREHLVDPASVDVRGDTALIAAIREDATHVIDFLAAEPGTDIEATDAANETALMLAAYKKRKDVVEKLIARDAEVNRVGWTALHYAASVGAGEIVDVLLEHSAYIDAESPNKTTPLMMAARGGFDAVCRQLVEAGADPTPINQRDLSAADFAKRANRDELAAWLERQSVAWHAKYGTSPPRRSPPAS